MLASLLSVGSIGIALGTAYVLAGPHSDRSLPTSLQTVKSVVVLVMLWVCLLYTSDAAYE